MASSDVARFLIKQYLRSWGPDEDNSLSSSDPILDRFKAIGKKLKDNSTALTNPESISWLYNLNDALTEWRFLNDQNKSIRRIFSFHDVTQMNERSAINNKLTGLETSLQTLLEKLLKAPSSQPNLLQLDRYTFYKPHPLPSTEGDVSDEREKRMLNWLLTPGDDFKAAGIYGTGGSGKTALVKNVLKQKSVCDKFKRVIWACLSQSTSKKEMETEDVRIMEYLLYRLGLDTDSLVGKIVHENRDWLREEVERRLQNSRNYILVLDDMWLCSDWFADDFLGKSLKKIGGGAIILTSRRKTVAEKIGDKNMLIHLDPSDYFSKNKDLGD